MAHGFLQCCHFSICMLIFGIWKCSQDVPLDCRAEVFFGEAGSPSSGTLVFDCSFLLPFRQRADILLSSTHPGVGDKVRRMH